MKSRIIRLTLLTALALTVLGPYFAQAAPPARWHVNGNGYVGLLVYKFNPADMSLSGTLLGTPCRGFMVGRRLVLHRKPKGTQIWEGWIMDPGLGAPGQPYYRGGYFIAGTISEGRANNSLYPWYGVPAGGGPPPWGGGGGGSGGGTGRNLLVNPSFEQGRPAGRFITLKPGSTDLPGWSIGGHSIDVVGNYWKSSHGSKSIDLFGSGPGRIAQSFATRPGRTYRVVFDLAANPECGSKTKIVHVDIAGVIRKTFSASSTGHNRSRMGWQRQAFNFTALGARSTIHFISKADPTGSTNCGPALDNAGVFEVVR